MTVKQLIEHLKTLPQDLPVMTYSEDDVCYKNACLDDIGVIEDDFQDVGYEANEPMFWNRHEPKPGGSNEFIRCENNKKPRKFVVV